MSHPAPRVPSRRRMHVLDHFDADAIRALCAGGEFFWLDLTAPTEEQIGELAKILDLPPLAVEDTVEFHQRPKIDDYGDRLLVVFYGAQPAADGAPLVEVHIHLAPGRVVTIHHARAGLIEAVRAKHAHTDHEVVYRIFDTLSESVLALVRGIETEVSGLEQRAFERPSAADRRRITELRARLFRLMQIIVPQRDMLAGGDDAIERVLGMQAGQAHHPFADVRDDLVLAVNLLAYCRELLAETLNVYLQATSNRLNQIATRLTVLATIFVPLTLITGFFGQNFGWLVRHIDSFADFAVLGIGGMVVPAAAIGLVLYRAGYLNSDGQ
jgi:magnesium transporter